MEWMGYKAPKPFRMFQHQDCTSSGVCLANGPVSEMRSDLMVCFSCTVIGYLG